MHAKPTVKKINLTLNKGNFHWSLNIFAKRSILDTRQVSEYASELPIKYFH